jgi:hypothetical protein
MPRAAGKQLAKYARGEISDALRTVAVLYEDDCEIVYLRDDLQKMYSPEQYKAVADMFRIEMSDSSTTNDETPLGRKHSLIHSHENAFVFQFPHEDCHSILMSVNPSVGSRLRSFLTKCQKRI